MTTADYLSLLNILVALFGVMFVAATVYEVTTLRRLRKEFEAFRADLVKENYRHQRAAHRVMASYGLTDPAQQVKLLQEAVAIDPAVFNGYNALGYAWMSLGEMLRAADAFKEAVHRHPDDKAGYCDLAFAYLQLGNPGLCREYLDQAVSIDPTASDDIAADPRFSNL
jgi:Tfp pilus assembly protein PilF